LVLAVLLSAGAGPSLAQDAQDLAKQAQNPVGKLMAVPFEFNRFAGVGPREDPQYVLNIQPYFPVSLPNAWTLIPRFIVPTLHQPVPAPGVDDADGLGEINVQLFFLPPKPGAIIWGFGPALAFPTATKDILGSGKLSIGPMAVALTIQGPWVAGVFAYNLFSVAGDSDRRAVSQLVAQPFANYNLPRGWYLVTAPIITSDWKADSDERWTVPLGGGVGKILSIGKQQLSTSLQAYYNVEHPSPGAEWSMTFTTSLLFPK